MNGGQGTLKEPLDHLGRFLPIRRAILLAPTPKHLSPRNYYSFEEVAYSGPFREVKWIWRNRLSAVQSRGLQLVRLNSCGAERIAQISCEMTSTTTCPEPGIDMPQNARFGETILIDQGRLWVPIQE